MIETICEIKIKGQTLSFFGRAHESLFKSYVLLDLRKKQRNEQLTALRLHNLSPNTFSIAQWASLSHPNH